MNVSQFQFSNLCGSVYTQGNVIFTSDGNTLLSPVGNRITSFDLVNHRTSTLPFENRKNVKCLALSPNDTLLLAIDDDGHSLLINLKRVVLLHEFHFKAPVRDAQFSPDGRYIAVTHKQEVQVWLTPALRKEFAPFVLHKTYTGNFDETTCIDWSPDSKYFVAGSKDLSSRVYSLDPIKDFVPQTLSGHREAVVGAFFSADGSKIYTLSKDASLFIWSRTEPEPEPMETDGSTGGPPGPKRRPPRLFSLEKKHHFNPQQFSKLVSCAFHRSAQLLVVGFSHGIFSLYEMPDINSIHSLSISSHKVTAAAINRTADWLAFGCGPLGQILVWEWQSETYVLKQQGHSNDVNAIAFSPDGQVIASGGDDGKLKLWNMGSGFCFSTQSYHTATISGIAFVPNGSAVVSCSSDGTVRAVDLIRYRNFRTMVSPNPVQFCSVAVDPGGEVVCASSIDTFEIYVWSLQTGRLLDVLAGHTAPVVSVAFSPTQPVLASASWDKTVILWDVFEGKAGPEKLTHESEVLAVSFRPDGKQLCSSCLDGTLNFWNPQTATQTAVIEGRRDISGGRKSADRFTAKHSAANKYFNSLCYSADGTCVLAGGNSRFVCIYDTAERILLRRFQISKNRSLEGVLDFLNSRNMTEAGPKDLIDDFSDSDEEAVQRASIALPGVTVVDPSVRNVRPAVRTKCVQFAPTGRAWATASSIGVLIYSVPQGLAFDPTNLDQDLTPESTRAALADRAYSRALLMSFRLNEQDLIKQVLESIPSSEIMGVVSAVPTPHVSSLLTFLGANLEKTTLIELYLSWSVATMSIHGSYIRQNTASFLPPLRNLHKAISSHHRSLATICDDNRYTLDYLCAMPQESADAAQILPTTPEPIPTS